MTVPVSATNVVHVLTDASSALGSLARATERAPDAPASVALPAAAHELSDPERWASMRALGAAVHTAPDGTRTRMPLHGPLIEAIDSYLTVTPATDFHGIAAARAAAMGSADGARLVLHGGPEHQVVIAPAYVPDPRFPDQPLRRTELHLDGPLAREGTWDFEFGEDLAAVVGKLETRLPAGREVIADHEEFLFNPAKESIHGVVRSIDAHAAPVADAGPALGNVPSTDELRSLVPATRSSAGEMTTSPARRSLRFVGDASSIESRFLPSMLGDAYGTERFVQPLSPADVVGSRLEAEQLARFRLHGLPDKHVALGLPSHDGREWLVRIAQPKDRDGRSTLYYDFPQVREGAFAMRRGGAVEVGQPVRITEAAIKEGLVLADLGERVRVDPDAVAEVPAELARRDSLTSAERWMVRLLNERSAVIEAIAAHERTAQEAATELRAIEGKRFKAGARAKLSETVANHERRAERRRTELATLMQSWDARHAALVSELQHRIGIMRAMDAPETRVLDTKVFGTGWRIGNLDDVRRPSDIPTYDTREAMVADLTRLAKSDGGARTFVGIDTRDGFHRIYQVERSQTDLLAAPIDTAPEHVTYLASGDKFVDYAGEGATNIVQVRDR